MTNPYGAPQPGPGQYGAVPPPPPGPLGGGYPPLPPFPPPPGGRSKLPWIIGGAVLGVLVLAGIGVLLLVLLSGGDDDDKASDDAPSSDSTSTASGLSPEEVVTAVLDAAKEDDCASGEEHLTARALDDDPCSSDEFDGLASGAVDYEITGEEATSDGDASVTVEFTGPDGGETYLFDLVTEDGAYKVDSWAPGAEPSDDPTDSTDDPTDASTGAAPPRPGGSSTASAVPNEPEAVAKAFLESILDGDCATALDLATAKAARQGGGCDAAGIPSGLGDAIDVTTKKATVNGDRATVPATLEVMGQGQPSKVSLVKEGGQWKVDDFAPGP